MLYAFSINFLILLLLLFSLIFSPRSLPSLLFILFKPFHGIFFAAFEQFFSCYCLILSCSFLSFSLARSLFAQMCYFPLVLLYSALLLLFLRYKLCIIQYKAPRRRSCHAMPFSISSYILYIILCRVYGTIIIKQEGRQAGK
jgi:hypothetical protein